MPYLTTRKNLKLQLSPGLVASYDIQPENGVGLFWDTIHTPDPDGDTHKSDCTMDSNKTATPVTPMSQVDTGTLRPD